MGETNWWEQMKDNHNKGHLRKLIKEQLKRMITTLNRESYRESAATVRFSGSTGNQRRRLVISLLNHIEPYFETKPYRNQAWQGRRCWMLFIWSFEIIACHKLACSWRSVRKDRAKEHVGSKKTREEWNECRRDFHCHFSLRDQLRAWNRLVIRLQSCASIFHQ